MRVVAGDATDTRIGAVEALTVGHAIRLEANVDFTSPAAAHNRFPGSMALSAKVRDIFSGKLPQVRGRRLVCLILKRAHQMSTRPGVTVLAGNAGFQVGELQLPHGHGARGVAAKTVLRLTSPQFPSDRFIQILRRQGLVSGCNFQAVDRRVIAHHAFQEVAVLLKDPGLSALAKTPANGQRDGSRPIGNRVDWLTFLGLHHICV